MSSQIITIVNATTNEVTEREMTEIELERLNQQILESKATETDSLLKAEARLAAEEKLLALGLTTEDLKALLG